MVCARLSADKHPAVVKTVGDQRIAAVFAAVALSTSAGTHCALARLHRHVSLRVRDVCLREAKRLVLPAILKTSGIVRGILNAVLQRYLGCDLRDAVDVARQAEHFLLDGVALVMLVVVRVVHHLPDFAVADTAELEHRAGSCHGLVERVHALRITSICVMLERVVLPLTVVKHGGVRSGVVHADKR